MTATALPLPVAVPTTRRRLGLLTLATALAPVTWGTTYVVTTEWLPPDRPASRSANNSSHICGGV